VAPPKNLKKNLIFYVPDCYIEKVDKTCCNNGQRCPGYG
jgi:hypothetical protein